MSTQDGDIHPVLQPIHIKGKDPPVLGVWFLPKDIKDEAVESEIKTESLGSKLKSKLESAKQFNSTSGADYDLRVVMIHMSEEDYNKYFATDKEAETGKYLPSVSEPPGGRHEYVRQKYEEQKPKERNIREIEIVANRGKGAKYLASMPATGPAGMAIGAFGGMAGGGGAGGGGGC